MNPESEWWVHQETREKTDQPDPPAKRDHVDPMVLLVKRVVLETQERMALTEPLEILVKMVPLASLELMDRPDPKVPVERMEHLDQQDQSDHQVLPFPELLVPKAAKETLEQ